MRYTIMFFVLFFTAFMCRGQEAPDFSLKLNEVNIGFSQKSEYGTNTCLGYKRMFNGGALRAGTELSFSSWSNASELNDSEIHYFQVSPKVGYEFHKMYGNFKIYYGADLVYSYGRSKSEDTWSDQGDVDINISRSQMVGLRPLLGLSVYIFKSFSISVESYIDITYYTYSDKYPEADDSWDNTSNGFWTTLVPLGLFSLNYHF